MNLNSFDVIIIGAGVSGSSAAYNLANAGLKVLVLEKEKLPRYKTCGGGIVFRASSLLPFGIEETIQRSYYAVDVIDNENETKFRIKRTIPVINMVMRSELDYYILKKAMEKSAVLNDQSEVTEIINEKNFVDVKTASQTFKAKYLIASDGATGFSMTKYKLNRNILRVPAVESEIVTDEEFFSKHKDVARFDFGFVPHGYGWIFPKKNHLSIGVAFMNKVNQSIQGWFSKYLEFLGLNNKNILKNEKHGYVIPLTRGKIISSIDRILFAGDTLGFADPLTAEGISYAIETGQLAARSLIKNELNHPKGEIDYKEKIENVYKEIKAARFLSRVVYGPRVLRKFIFKHYGKGLSELLAEIITNKEKYSKLVNNPLNYLELVKPKHFLDRN
jgi:geranylgeranyl reductase family protein